MSMDFWRPRKESKSDPLTNREWLESLSNKQLAEFLTCGLYVRELYEIYSTDRDRVMNIYDIKMRYIQSRTGIEQWLNSPQEFEVISEAD